MRVSNSSFRVRFPTSVLIYGLFLVGVGLLTISSAAKVTQPNLFLNQLLWFAIACLVATIISAFQTRTLSFLAYPIYFGVMFLLFGVLAFGLVVKGSQRWIDLGFMRIQPSELAKIAIVLATAKYCASYEVYGGYRLRDLFRPFNLSRPLILCLGSLVFIWKMSDYWFFGVLGVFLAILWSFYSLKQIAQEGLNIYQIVSLFDLMLLPFVLILVQPDLGTSLIVLAIAFSMLLFSGVRPSSLGIATIVGIGVMLVGWLFVLKDYQKERVYTFLNPEADVMGKGYHAIQSMIAVGSGQFFGKGYGEGTQTQLSFLPENHTDFIFSVLAEEWGFFGVLVVLFLFLGLILSMISVASKAKDRFASLLAVGAASLVFWHMTINIAMVIGLLPVVGVPLPFVSYGGASMVVQVTALALCINVSLWRKIR